MKYDTATPFVAVYIVFRNDNKIAFLLRENTQWMNGHYGLPGGKVEKNESLLSATIREAKEEVGVDLKPENLNLILTGQRHHSDTDWIDIVFEASSWDGELYNAEPHMHAELTWFDPENLPENMVPYTRDYIAHVQISSNYIEWGWQR